MTVAELGLDEDYKQNCLARIDAIRQSISDDVKEQIIRIPQGPVYMGGRVFYPIGSVADPVTEQLLYFGIKTEPNPEDETGYHNLFHVLGLPVPCFCGVVRYGNTIHTITEDLTHGGEYDLAERFWKKDPLEIFLQENGVTNKDRLTDEYERYSQFLWKYGYFNDYSGSTDFVRALFLQVKPNKEGRWIAGDLPGIHFLLPNEIKDVAFDPFVCDVFQTEGYTIKL